MDIKSMDVFNGSEYKEKGSKFFGYLVKIESSKQVTEILAELKKEHKHAGHFCYAYRVNELVSGAQISIFQDKTYKEKYSNDGEPSGVGMALMNLLVNSKIEDCVVVVVRYWGGVLLGSGNLIRAYVTAAKSALDKHLNLL